MSDIPWPRNNREIFVPDGPPSDVALLGWGGLSQQFAGFAWGYKAAADAILDKTLADAGPRFRDTTAMPVLFLYRQFIELELKRVVLEYSDIGKDAKRELLKKFGHDLMKWWEKAATAFAKGASDEDVQSLEVVEKYVRQVHEADKGSFTFRYPIQRDLMPTLSQAKYVNLRELKLAMQEIENFFEGAISHAIEVHATERDAGE